MKIILAPIGVVALARTTVAHTLRYHGSKQTLDGGSIKSSFDAMLHHPQKTTTDRVEISDANPAKPRSLVTGYNCIGNKLMGGSNIGREEFVCSRDGKYRFGLDENGMLGEWHGHELNWSPGLSGSRLYMQNQDGNLVLRDESGQPLWAINCGGNPKAFLYAKHGGNGGVRVLSESDKKIIWRTWHSGADPTCFPKNEADPGDFNCVSETLNADMRALFKNQFICGNTWYGTMYAFGLDKDGRLGGWRNGELHWSPGASGYRLQMQGGDGNLVLYEEDGTAVWATNCGHFPGAYLRSNSPNTHYSVNSGAEVIVGSTTIWKTLNNGDSTCFPGYKEKARCVGSRLDEDRRSLGRGEYICNDSGLMFGLNQDGLLGLWTPRVWTRSDGLLWSPGLYGAYLYMQYGDGNLVLRDAQGTPVRATGCKAPPGEHFYLVAKYADGVQIMDNGDNIIWKVWGNGIESECNPPNIEPPQTKCKSLFEVDDVLHRNEYVCDNSQVSFTWNDKDHWFGLNNLGQLVIWEGRKTIWTLGDLSGGDRLVLNSDSLRVYAADGGIMWTSCPVSGGRIDMTSDSVQLVDSGGVAWFFDYHSGVSSTCNPPNIPQYDCQGAIPYDCHVNVIDNANSRNVQMGIQRSVPGYRDFDIWGNEGCFTYYYNGEIGRGDIIMYGSLDTSSILLTDDTAQYTLRVSCEDLSIEYIMQDDDQFQFMEAASSDCTDLSRSLIYYAIKKNSHSIWEFKDRPGQPFVP